MKSSSLQILNLKFQVLQTTVRVFSLFLLLLSSKIASAQVPHQVHNLNNYKDTIGWYDFRDSIFVRRDSFFLTYKTHFGLGEHDSMVPVKFEYDSIVPGQYHVTYQQIHKGLPIEHGVFKLHCHSGIVQTAHGRIIQNITTNLTCSISEDSALQKIKNYLIIRKGADSFLWETPLEDSLKVRDEDTSLTYKPLGLLGFYKKFNTNYLFPNYVYGYKFRIHWIKDTISFYDEYIVSSCDTNIYYLGTPVRHNNNANGTLLNYGYKSFRNEQKLGRYYLQDKTRGDMIRVEKQISQSTTVGHLEKSLWDGDGNWGTREQKSTTALWSIQNVWDFWVNELKRKGSDNKGKAITIVTEADGLLWLMPASYMPPTVLASETNNNRLRGKDVIHLGSTEINSVIYQFYNLQTIGHEFTHAVSENSAQLTQSDIEAYSIEEGICDALGVAAHFYATGVKDYKMEESGISIRNLSNPHSSSSYDDGAKYYLEPGWWQSASSIPAIMSENAHSNGLVVGYWFYLLSEGSNNTAINGAVVYSIGINKASKILARAFTVYLTSSSQFKDLRNACIQAAKDLYGECSDEVTQTMNAWQAVHVGTSQPMCINMNASHRVICTEKGIQNVVITASATFAGSSSGITYSNWTLPSGWSGSASGNTYTVTSYTSNSPAMVSVIASKTINGTTYQALGRITFYIFNCGGFGEGPIPLNNPSIDLNSETTFYPNPIGTFQEMYIDGYNSNLKYELFDLNGRKIKEILSSSFSVETQGMYLIKVTNPDSGLSKTIKIAVIDN